MNATSQIKQDPPDISKKGEQLDTDTVIAVYGSILKAYPDTEKLSVDVEEARRRVDSLRLTTQAMHSRLAKIDTKFNHIKAEVTYLKEFIDQDETLTNFRARINIEQPFQEDSKFEINVHSALDALKDESVNMKHCMADSEKIRTDLVEACDLYSRLQGIKALIDASGRKRPKVEASESADRQSKRLRRSTSGA